MYEQEPQPREPFISKSTKVSLGIAAGVATLLLILSFFAAQRIIDDRPEPALSRRLTAEHTDAIQKALKAKGYPPPTLTVSDSGYLVATFELQSLPQQPLRAYAEDALLTIRNTMLPFHAFETYRVTLNGPSPGPGLIRRYGNARFIEGGGGVRWEPAE